MHVLHNGKVVAETGILEGHAVVVEADKIKKIIPETEVAHYPEACKVDAQGGYIAPGFIDIHSDYIETMVAPRPKSMINLQLGLRETERILASHGITTMFHSLSFYREDMFTNKVMRRPENVQRLVETIYEARQEQHLIRHRLHARFEIDNVDQVEQLAENMRAGKVHLLSFMDHTPGQGQYRDLEVFRETLKGYRNLNDLEIDAIIADRQNSECMTLDAIRELANLAISKGIAVASHDDDEVQKLELVQTFGTTISEFPITMEVAKRAKELGLLTVVGAPNVLLGGSHSGNLSAAEAIKQGCVDVLCSDYYPASLLHAVFALSMEYGHDLHDMFQLVTLNPAKAVGMDQKFGSIKAGKKADLLLISQMEDGYPLLTGTMVDGKMIAMTNYRVDHAVRRQADVLLGN